jgi:predicted Zn finger-like uncharacterized protein
MPISARCPGCQAQYVLADNLAGKRVRCKKCQEPFTVASPSTAGDEPMDVIAVDEPTPRRAAPRRDGLQSSPRTPPPLPGRQDRHDEDRPRRRMRDDEDDEPRSGAGNAPVGLIIGIAGGVLFLLIVGVTLAMLLSHDSSTTTPVVSNNPPPALRPPLEVPKPPPKIIPPPPQVPPPALPAAPVVKPPAPAVPWRVQPDPVKEPLAVAAPTSIPVSAFQANAIFPTTPSPFVVLSQKGMPTEIREVYDLRTGRRVGTVRPPAGHSDFALSTDGTQLVARALAPKPWLEVWSVADGRSLWKFEVDDKPSFLQTIDFVASGQILTGKAVGVETLFQVWDVATTRAVRQFQASAHPDVKLRALSGNRKYLAFPRQDNKAIAVYDLTTGELAGEAAVPGLEFGILLCSALAFSPDGKTLSGFFAAGFDGHLISWDVAGGKVSADLKMEKDPQWLAQHAHAYQGRRLEWFPDGSALLAYGQLIIDPKTAKVVWTVPPEGFDGSARRVVGPELLATVKGGFNEPKKLVLEKLPRDKIDTAVGAVRAGRDPAATKLPAATPAD